MELERPVHKMLVRDVVFEGGSAADLDVEGGEEGGLYGHIVHSPGGDDLVGSVGCASEVLVSAPTVVSVEGEEDDAILKAVDAASGKTGAEGESESLPMTVLTKGSFRFVVREVLKTFPYPVGIVDELLDEEEPDKSTKTVETVSISLEDDDDKDEDDDEKEGDEALYIKLSPSELLRRTLSAMETLASQKVSSLESKSSQAMSPLEQSILEQKGFIANTGDGLGLGIGVPDADAKKSQAEEMAAIVAVFKSSLSDIAPTPTEQYYAVGMLGAEFADTDNEFRSKVLKSRDGIARLSMVLKELEHEIGRNAAMKLAEEAVAETTDEDEKELKVGTPELPPWAFQISKGQRLEYFWNEEYGWCPGVVLDEPVQIVDEILLTVTFDDGETHKLPFRADEKARWRPADWDRGRGFG